VICIITEIGILLSHCNCYFNSSILSNGIAPYQTAECKSAPRYRPESVGVKHANRGQTAVMKSLHMAVGAVLDVSRIPKLDGIVGDRREVVGCSTRVAASVVFLGV